MSDRSSLHGSAPDRADTALLLVDTINDLEFDRGAALLRTALPAARRIAHLAERCRRAGIPVIYANDNFGRWRSDFQALVRHCLEAKVRGRPIAELLLPREHDYFVLKPRHSAFYSTSLEILLRHLGVERLIIVGFAGNICVLFTANDAYLRGFQIVIPADCVASNTATLNRNALELMKQVLHADTRVSRRLRLRPAS